MNNKPDNKTLINDRRVFKQTISVSAHLTGQHTLGLSTFFSCINFTMQSTLHENIEPKKHPDTKDISS